MRLRVVSDLHLEAPAAYDTFAVSTENAQHLALLGDIGHVQNPGLFQFLSKQLLRFATVFFVCGNHEPYHSDWPTAIEEISDFGEKSNSERRHDSALGEFVFLNRTRYVISASVTILGCTLFSSNLVE
jgi:predicted phosphodiesterase